VCCLQLAWTFLNQDKDMSSVRGLLSGSMKRLNALVEQSGSKHLCYLVLFVVIVLMIVFFMTKS
jgi:blocked-early-in-transport protein 1